ncbi:MAG TPA: hypothetical protein VMO26_22520 [Vicinamibacterales bacterium]|nr:hypothetical protein [Vicinamibacterales bacterium]
MRATAALRAWLTAGDFLALGRVGAFFAALAARFGAVRATFLATRRAAGRAPVFFLGDAFFAGVRAARFAPLAAFFAPLAAFPERDRFALFAAFVDLFDALVLFDAFDLAIGEPLRPSTTAQDAPSVPEGALALTG